MMRQAGRYLPEYRELRAKAGSFLDLCYTPEYATEVTLQPIRRFGFDGAILFSDILIIPHALGLGVDFVEGEGPKVERLGPDRLDRLGTKLDATKTGKVYEAVSAIRGKLSDETTLIGFVGGPWTVATYIAAGGSSPDHAEAKDWAKNDPRSFADLIARLVDASVEHLSGQISAGAEVVQIFDSWAGDLAAPDFEMWCTRPMREIVLRLRERHPGIPVIAFPRRAGAKLAAFAQALPDVAIGLDTSETPEAVNALLPPSTPVQGNLDPEVLIEGGARLDSEIDRIRQGFAGRPHIFNLGHGIKPHTPIAHVEQLVARVRESV